MSKNKAVKVVAHADAVRKSVSVLPKHYYCQIKIQ